MMKGPVSEKTVERLTLYRRILNQLQQQGVPAIHSHELARRAGASAAQVRRDIMALGYEGSPSKGYSSDGLVEALKNFLDDSRYERLALVGVGNVGRSLLAYFDGGTSHLTITAAFDSDPSKTGRLISGCPCHALEDMKGIISQEELKVAVVAVPGRFAQETAQQLIHCGITGILNYTSAPLALPNHIFVETVDLTMMLEKVAYFARSQA